MDKNHLSVREIKKEDIEPIIGYWLNSEPAFLEGMGVDLKKMPTGEQWKEMLNEQINQPYLEKNLIVLSGLWMEKPLVIAT